MVIISSGRISFRFLFYLCFFMATCVQSDSLAMDPTHSPPSSPPRPVRSVRSPVGARRLFARRSSEESSILKPSFTCEEVCEALVKFFTRIYAGDSVRARQIVMGKLSEHLARFITLSPSGISRSAFNCYFSECVEPLLSNYVTASESSDFSGVPREASSTSTVTSTPPRMAPLALPPITPWRGLVDVHRASCADVLESVIANLCAFHNEVHGAVDLRRELADFVNFLFVLDGGYVRRLMVEPDASLCSRENIKLRLPFESEAKSLACVKCLSIWLQGDCAFDEAIEHYLFINSRSLETLSLFLTRALTADMVSFRRELDRSLTNIWSCAVPPVECHPGQYKGLLVWSGELMQHLSNILHADSTEHKAQFQLALLMLGYYCARGLQQMADERSHANLSCVVKAPILGAAHPLSHEVFWFCEGIWGNSLSEPCRCLVKQCDLDELVRFRLGGVNRISARIRHLIYALHCYRSTLDEPVLAEQCEMFHADAVGLYREVEHYVERLLLSSSNIPLRNTLLRKVHERICEYIPLMHFGASELISSVYVRLLILVRKIKCQFPDLLLSRSSALPLPLVVFNDCHVKQVMLEPQPGGGVACQGGHFQIDSRALPLMVHKSIDLVGAIDGLERKPFVKDCFGYIRSFNETSAIPSGVISGRWRLQNAQGKAFLQKEDISSLFPLCYTLNNDAFGGYVERLYAAIEFFEQHLSDGRIAVIKGTRQPAASRYGGASACIDTYVLIHKHNLGCQNHEACRCDTSYPIKVQMYVHREVICGCPIATILTVYPLPLSGGLPVPAVAAAAPK